MLRFATLGAGLRSRICQYAHRPDQGIVFAAVCDPNPEALRRTEQLYPGIQTFTDHRDLLANGPYDAVFVTSPDHLHEEHALAALETGAAVYLEKPLGITLESCDRILAAAHAQGGRLYVGHNMRFSPVIQKMREIIDSGRIGQVQAIWCRHFIDYGGDAYFKDWHSERRYATGLLLQKAAHDIDVIHHLAGGYTRRVVGMGKLSVYNQVADRREPHERVSVDPDPANWPPLEQKKLSPVIDVEDHSMIMMQLDNGVQASYVQCHYTPDGWRNYTVIGTRGRIENGGDLENRFVRIFERRGGSTEGDQIIPLPPLAGGHGGADPLIVEDFLAFVRTGRHTGATPLDARQAVAVGFLGTRSLREGNLAFDVPPVSV